MDEIVTHPLEVRGYGNILEKKTTPNGTSRATVSSSTVTIDGEEFTVYEPTLDTEDTTAEYYDYYYAPLVDDNEVVCLNSGGLRAVNGVLESYVVDSFWGIGYIKDGWVNSNKWTLRFQGFAKNNRGHPCSFYITPENPSDFTTCSLEIRASVYSVQQPYDLSIWSNKNGTSTLLASQHGDTFWYRGDLVYCDPKKFMLTKNGNDYTLVYEDKDVLTFTTDIFEETEKVTMGLARSNPSDSMYSGGELSLKNVFVTLKTVHEYSKHVKLGIENHITSTGEYTNIPVSTGMGNVSVVMINTEDPYDYVGTKTDSSGLGTLRLNTPYGNVSRSYIVKALKTKDTLVTVDMETNTLYYNGFGSALPAQSGGYGYNCESRGLEVALSTQTQIYANRVDRYWTAPYTHCPTRDYEWEYRLPEAIDGYYDFRWVTVDGQRVQEWYVEGVTAIPTVWAFIINKDWNYRFRLGINGTNTRTWLQVKWGNTAEYDIEIPKTVLDINSLQNPYGKRTELLPKVYVRKIGTEWSVYIDDYHVVTLTYDITAPFVVGNPVGGLKEGNTTDTDLILNEFKIKELVPQPTTNNNDNEGD